MMGRQCWRCLLLLLMAMPGHVTSNTDVVIFNNGDRLTGEVKSLERGRLRFKTNATDTISIEWDNVAFLSSDQNIQIETEQGRRILGHLSRANEEYRIIVEAQSGPVELASSSVVLMSPIEERGISRLDGDITAGYNFTKANEVTQFQLGLDMDFRTETRIVSLSVDTITSDSKDIESSQRQSLDIQYRRLWPNRWLTGGFVNLDRNDELDLDLRTSIGAGGGRILHQTNQTNLALEAGLMVSRENVSGSISNEDTLETFGSLTWDWFRYDSPELDLSTSLQLIPNLTDTGRVRGELEINLKWEMIEDLFWELIFYDSYDSDPVVLGAEKNDYGVITSLGWEF